MGTMTQTVGETAVDRQDGGSSVATDELSRQGFLKWVSRAGLAVVAASATVLAKRKPASANHCGPGLVHAGCCCLFGRDQVGTCWSNCPGGSFRMRSWTCCVGSSLLECGECITSPTCYGAKGARVYCSGTRFIGVAC
jgi:hypothetical protein